MEVYRLIDVQHAGLILDGASAALTGGRWNPRGRAVLYTSCNVSLAILELLSHYQRPFACARYCVATIRVPDTAITRLDPGSLPPRWRNLLHLTRQEGVRWLESGSLALLVPSAVHAHDDNLLINPAHPRFPEITLASCAPLTISPSVATMSDEAESTGAPDPLTCSVLVADPSRRSAPDDGPGLPAEQIPLPPDRYGW